MTELEVKRCIVTCAGMRDIAIIQFGQGETLDGFFQNQEDIDLLVEMDIGEKGMADSTTFSLRVVSVEALHRRHLHLKQGAKNKHFVFYDCTWQKVEGKLAEIIRSCQDYSYEDSCEKLCRYLNWEYEDMQ